MMRILLSSIGVCLVFATILLVARGKPSPPVATDFDVVVVGGGLAGLAAANELNGLRVIVLEKENRLGGRVYSGQFEGMTYELGALFASPELLTPESGTQGLLTGGEDIGFWDGERLHRGVGAHELVRSVGFPAKDAAAVRLLAEGAPGALNSSSPALRAMVDSLFHAIHPGPITRYVPARRADALIRFDTDRMAQGNAQLVDRLVGKIDGEIRRGVYVEQVADSGQAVSIKFRQDGFERQLTSRAVIVATPGPVAARLLTKLSPFTREFLDALSYGSGRVVAMFVRAASFAGLRYVAVAGSPIDAVFFHPTPDQTVTLVTAYFVGDYSGVPTQVSVTAVRDQLQRMGLWEPKAGAPVFADVRDWPMLGTIIDSKTYGRFDRRSLKPSERVFLAGDYTLWDNQRQMPYGMAAALESGRKTAAEVRQFLR